MTRWRQGQSVPHHVYAMRGDEPDTRPWPDGDPPVATFLDPGDALRAVEAVNGGLTEDSIGIRAERDALRDELHVEVQRRDDVIAELRRVIKGRDKRIGVLERKLQQPETESLTGYPPRDLPGGDWAVLRSAGAIRTWRGQNWTWTGDAWTPGPEST